MRTEESAAGAEWKSAAHGIPSRHVLQQCSPAIPFQEAVQGHPSAMHGHTRGPLTAASSSLADVKGWLW